MSKMWPSPHNVQTHHPCLFLLGPGCGRCHEAGRPWGSRSGRGSHRRGGSSDAWRGSISRDIGWNWQPVPSHWSMTLHQYNSWPYLSSFCLKALKLSSVVNADEMQTQRLRELMRGLQMEDEVGNIYHDRNRSWCMHVVHANICSAVCHMLEYLSSLTKSSKYWRTSRWRSPWLTL